MRKWLNERCKVYYELENSYELGYLMTFDKKKQLKKNYTIMKKINGGWNACYELENGCELWDFWFWDKNKLILDTLIVHVTLYDYEVWGYNIFREFWRMINKSKKKIKTYILKLKENHSILSFSHKRFFPHWKHCYRTRYLIYKSNKITWNTKRFLRLLQNPTKTIYI